MSGDWTGERSGIINPPPDPANAAATELIIQRKRWLKRAMVLAKELGYTDEDRHELSILLVGADRDPSWAKFDHNEMGRCVDMLLGATAHVVIMRDRRVPDA